MQLSVVLRTAVMLVFSNLFMTFAWYGQLKLREFKWFESLPLVVVILMSWGIAFFEYYFTKEPQNKHLLILANN